MANEPRNRRYQWWRRAAVFVVAAAVTAAVGWGATRALEGVFDDEVEPPSLPEVSIVTAESRLADRGDPTAEYVCLVNGDDEPVDLTAWTLTDSAGHRFAFPQLELAPGARVRVHTGVGESTNTDVYWGRDAAVWNDGTDSIVLANADGDIVDEQHYSSSTSTRPSGDCE
jgi:hypothetical protein